MLCPKAYHAVRAHRSLVVLKLVGQQLSLAAQVTAHRATAAFVPGVLRKVAHTNVLRAQQRTELQTQLTAGLEVLWHLLGHHLVATVTHHKPVVV